MHISLPSLALALASIVIATPLSPLSGVNQACYYRRDLDAYVRRDASNSEILCGKTKQQNAKRSPTLEAFVESANEKRHHANAETPTNEKRHHANADTSLNEKRHHAEQASTNDGNAGYKRHHANADVSLNEKRHHANAETSSKEKRHHANAEISTNGKRHHASETEIMTIDKRIPPADNACYYHKRDLDSGVLEAYKRDASNAEVLCGGASAEKRIPPPKPVNNACYYKRDLDTDTLVAYKRDVNNAEIQCGAAVEKRIPPKKTTKPVDHACYYKRDLARNELVAYKRDVNNAEILCDGVIEKRVPTLTSAIAPTASATATLAISATATKKPPKPVDHACYYRRDLKTLAMVAYKRDASNAEILCDAVAP